MFKHPRKFAYSLACFSAFNLFANVSYAVNETPSPKGLHWGAADGATDGPVGADGRKTALNHCYYVNDADQITARLDDSACLTVIGPKPDKVERLAPPAGHKTAYVQPRAPASPSGVVDLASQNKVQLTLGGVRQTTTSSTAAQVNGAPAPIANAPANVPANAPGNAPVTPPANGAAQVRKEPEVRKAVAVPLHCRVSSHASAGDGGPRTVGRVTVSLVLSDQPGHSLPMPPMGERDASELQTSMQVACGFRDPDAVCDAFPKALNAYQPKPRQFACWSKPAKQADGTWTLSMGFKSDHGAKDGFVEIERGLTEDQIWDRGHALDFGCNNNEANLNQLCGYSWKAAKARKQAAADAQKTRAPATVTVGPTGVTNTPAQ